MKKLLLLLSILLTGCATYVGVEQPTSTIPIYPPMYNIKPMQQYLVNSLQEAQRLKQFVDNSGGMLQLQYALDFYIRSNQDLYNKILNPVPAQIKYQPWQADHYVFPSN